MPLRKKPKKSKVQNVTPKVYNGVQYKSTLEAYCARKLTEAGLPVNYETWKVVLQQKFTAQVECWEPKTKKNKATGLNHRTFGPVGSAVRQAIYTPDFHCHQGGWVIETKGLRDTGFNMRWRNFREHLHREGLHHYRLYLPGNHSEVDQVISHILQNTQ